MTFYVLIPKGYLPISAGQTKEEVLAFERDLTQSNDVKYTTVYADANDGDLVLIECTVSLYKEIKEEGLGIYKVTNNIADTYK